MAPHGDSAKDMEVFTMNPLPSRQNGASAVVTIILLVALAYGVYIGIQYLPLFIESRSVDAMLDSIESDHKVEPITSAYDLRAKLEKHLELNQMRDLADRIDVSQNAGGYTVTVAYERELNLLYERRTIDFRHARRLH